MKICKVQKYTKIAYILSRVFFYDNIISVMHNSVLTAGNICERTKQVYEQ